MNNKTIFQILGVIIGYIGLSMLVPLTLSIYFRDGMANGILLASVVTSLSGFSIFYFFKRQQSNAETTVSIRDGFIIVSFAWLITVLIGTLPYIFTGTIPNFTDALFESTSGFTTTGATILSDIEGLPASIIFWRSFTHWIGGIGIVVVTISVMPLLGVAGMQLFKAETPGPTTDKLSPRVKETTRILGMVYIVITLIIFISFWLGGMTAFDAVCHSFAAIGTGGFSTKNTSIAFYKSSLIEYIAIFGMFISAINFSLHYRALKGSFKDYFKSEELKWFASIILITTAIISVDIMLHNNESLADAFRKSLFNVVSLITTTGFGAEDYEKWSFGSQLLLVTIMYIGGMAGSTAGGIKVIRFALSIKLIYNGIKKHIHPKAILPIRINGTPVDRGILINVLIFTLFYAIVAIVAVISLGFLGLDVPTSIGAVATTMNGVGPGIGAVGPTENFGPLPDMAKWISCALMLLGRLEIFTVLVLFTPTFWRK